MVVVSVVNILMCLSILGVRHSSFCFPSLRNTLTFFLSSGLPFLTVATNMSPTPAAGRRFRRPRMPCTAITYRFLAPEKCVLHLFSTVLHCLQFLFAHYLCCQRSSSQRLRANPARCGICLPRYHHVLNNEKHK